MKLKQTCISLISALTIVACHHTPQTTDTDVFAWYADEMNICIPEAPHRFVIVPVASCGGCRAAVALYASHPDSSTTVIVSGKLAPMYVNTTCMIDSACLCDRLNWNQANIVEIFTSLGRADSIVSNDAAQTILKFAPDAHLLCTDNTCQ